MSRTVVAVCHTCARIVRGAYLSAVSSAQMIAPVPSTREAGGKSEAQAADCRANGHEVRDLA